MRLTRRTLLTVSGTSLGLAGCLGDDGTTTDEGTGTTTSGESNGDSSGGTESDDGGSTEGTGTSSGSATVQVSSNSEHGDILVGPDGSSLYMFDQDTQGDGASSCYDGCADSWPPLTAEGEPTASDDVTADLTTFERDEGSMQVAAAGWPLYYFAADEGPGDVTGQGVNDVWWLLTPDGTPVKPDAGY